VCFFFNIWRLLFYLTHAQLVELGEGSPFETLHSLVRNSISPLVRSYLKLHNKEQEETKDVKSGIGMGAVNQKVAELELSLYNCKQNIEIPSIVLTYHPEVKAAAKKVIRNNNNKWH